MLFNIHNAVNGFFQDNVVWISLIIVFVVLAIIGVLIFIFIKKKKRPKKPHFEAHEYFDAVGGKTNIKSVSLNGSRITLELYDNTKINNDKLHTLGVDNILTMSHKFIFVIKNDAKEFYKHLV